MDNQHLIIIAIALAAGLASPLGGLFAMVLRPSTLTLSIAVGFAGGVLLGTFAFEMLPQALELSSLGVAVVGFAAGFALVYALDLYVNRGAFAGEKADQKAEVERLHRRKKPHGSSTAVLAGGTSAEELIEGLSIGLGGAIDPKIALIVGFAIFVDNLSEGLSVGELLRKEGGKNLRRRILIWTGAIGLSLFLSALAGVYLLGNLPGNVLGFLLALGAGGMFYLTISELIPEAEEHHYQQSAAIAVGAGFLLVFVLTQFG